MSSSLAGVPISRRRRAARLAALVAVVMLGVFVVAWVRPAPATIRLLAVLALVGAIMLATMSWAVLRTVRMDEAEAALDAAIVDSGVAYCTGCGHRHDPTELHVSDRPVPQ